MEPKRSRWSRNWKWDGSRVQQATRLIALGALAGAAAALGALSAAVLGAGGAWGFLANTGSVPGTGAAGGLGAGVGGGASGTGGTAGTGPGSEGEREPGRPERDTWWDRLKDIAGQEYRDISRGVDDFRRDVRDFFDGVREDVAHDLAQDIRDGREQTRRNAQEARREQMLEDQER